MKYQVDGGISGGTFTSVGVEMMDRTHRLPEIHKNSNRS